MALGLSVLAGCLVFCSIWFPYVRMVNRKED